MIKANKWRPVYDLKIKKLKNLDGVSKNAIFLKIYVKPYISKRKIENLDLFTGNLICYYRTLNDK